MKRLKPRMILQFTNMHQLMLYIRGKNSARADDVMREAQRKVGGYNSCFDFVPIFVGSMSILDPFCQPCVFLVSCSSHSCQVTRNSHHREISRATSQIAHATTPSQHRYILFCTDMKTQVNRGKDYRLITVYSSNTY